MPTCSKSIGRKCLIFTNDGTLASFVALDVLKDDVANLPSIHEEYNEINEAILAGVGVRPDHCPLRADAMANFDPTAPAHKWSRGFAVGFNWILEAWEGILGKRGLGQLHEIASDLLFFSSREAAIEVLELAGRPTDSIIDEAEDAREDFYHSARSVARIGRAAQRPMGDGGLVM